MQILDLEAHAPLTLFFCELAAGLQGPKFLARSGAKWPIVSGGYLKYSRFGCGWRPGSIATEGPRPRVSCADLDTDRGASVGDVSFQQAQNRSQLSGA